MPLKHLTNTRRYWYCSQTKLMSVDMIAINTVQFSHQLLLLTDKRGRITLTTPVCGNADDVSQK